MELHRRHLHSPDHVRRMRNAELVCIPIETRKVHAYRLDPWRRSKQQPLLMHFLTVDSIGEAVHMHSLW